MLVLGGFILLATGSMSFLQNALVLQMGQTTEYNSEDDSYEKEVSYRFVDRVYKGERDEYGRWQGDLRIETTYEIVGSGKKVTSYELVDMYNGLRDGKSLMEDKDGEIVIRDYSMGKHIKSMWEKKQLSVSQIFPHSRFLQMTTPGFCFL